jgi:hypothetical protein
MASFAPSAFTGDHNPMDSDEFRAGIVYAAHVLRHMVNMAHGHSGFIPASAVPSAMARREILAFAEGAAVGLEEIAEVPLTPHTHEGVVDHTNRSQS